MLNRNDSRDKKGAGWCSFLLSEKFAKAIEEERHQNGSTPSNVRAVTARYFMQFIEETYADQA
jgi:hypothetical protein